MNGRERGTGHPDLLAPLTNRLAYCVDIQTANRVVESDPPKNREARKHPAQLGADPKVRCNGS